ncbi:MAG: thiolase C-terminal domain-containing protein, partial [Thermoprotei archaeon]
MRRVYVAGVGMVKVGKYVDKSLRDLAGEAALKAMEEAGNEVPEALVVGNMLSSLIEQENLASLIGDHLGLRGACGFKVEGACGSGGVAVLTGYSLVASGLFSKVLVVGVEKLFERPSSDVIRGLAYAADADYELIYGVTFSGLNALLMRYYMSKYGVKYEELAYWSVLMHKNGSRNPYAQLRYEITLEDVLKSPLIADPIRLYDSCPLSDGASAVFLASEDSKRLTDTPVIIAGIGNSIDSVDLTSRLELDHLLASRVSAESALRMAKTDLREVEVAEVHDAYTITAALSIESIGFAERGKAPKAWSEGRFSPGDKPSLNLSGGLKSRGHPVGATGVYQLAEVVMQLRGDFPGVSVPAEVGLTQNIGGAGSN